MTCSPEPRADRTAASSSHWRLHHHPGDAELSKPVDHPQQQRHRLVGPDLLHAPPFSRGPRDPHATDELGLTDVDSGDPLDILFPVPRCLATLRTVRSRYDVRAGRSSTG